MRLAAPDDPNGYRAPAFANENRPAFRPVPASDVKDVDDDRDGQVAMMGPRGNSDRFGQRASLGAPAARTSAPMRDAGPSAPRREPSVSSDRSGTNPDAYRSPGFAAAAVSEPDAAKSGATRRGRRPRRMRFEAVCGDCGVAAQVPFEPAPDRPAYCKTCYGVRKANGTVPRATASASDAPGAGASPAIAAPGPESAAE